LLIEMSFLEMSIPYLPATELTVPCSSAAARHYHRHEAGQVRLLRQGPFIQMRSPVQVELAVAIRTQRPFRSNSVEVPLLLYLLQNRLGFGGLPSQTVSRRCQPNSRDRVVDQASDRAPALGSCRMDL
jgi:hypothetical protein